MDYMLTGSFAGSYHGIPRATQDIDLVIHETEDQVIRFAAMIGDAGFYVSQEAAREAVQSRGQFNVVDRSGGWKAPRSDPPAESRGPTVTGGGGVFRRIS